jgi:hypothetical protein
MPLTTILGAIRPLSNILDGKIRLRPGRTMEFQYCTLISRSVWLQLTQWPSFSEYGCKDNGRTFEEVASLYSTKMAGVFSGGLAYEYSLEETGYGVVQIKPDKTVVELEGFNLLANALKNTPDPEGNGGYKEQGVASQCPKPSKWWIPKNSSLPRLPGIANSYFQNGAGAPRGNEGAPKCSHWCGKNSTGLESEEGTNGGDGGTKNVAKNHAVARGVNVLGVIAGCIALAFL